jgi:hypothetical protein
MAKKESFQDLFDKYRVDPDIARKSKTWFEQQALLLNKQSRNFTPNRLMNNNPDVLSSKVIPGKLYMFLYDPKTKEQLPYYDTFPMVFPYQKVPGGFMGLNMHYLPYQLRVRLLDRLMVFASNKKMDETTRIRYSWATIAGLSKFNLAIPCIKHYLDNHVRSQFKLVPADDWATAMMIPAERFVGAKKEVVWTDSVRKSR